MSETDDTLIFMSKPTRTLNKYSSQITQPKAQGASQAMLYATGLTERDMSKPQVGISSIWYEGNSCNMHLLGLAEKVKEGVTAADHTTLEMVGPVMASNDATTAIKSFVANGPSRSPRVFSGA